MCAVHRGEPSCRGIVGQRQFPHETEVHTSRPEPQNGFCKYALLHVFGSPPWTSSGWICIEVVAFCSYRSSGPSTVFHTNRLDRHWRRVEHARRCCRNVQRVRSENCWCCQAVCRACCQEAAGSCAEAPRVVFHWPSGQASCILVTSVIARLRLPAGKPKCIQPAALKEATVHRGRAMVP